MLTLWQAATHASLSRTRTRTPLATPRCASGSTYIRSLSRSLSHTLKSPYHITCYRAFLCCWPAAKFLIFGASWQSCLALPARISRIALPTNRTTHSFQFSFSFPIYRSTKRIFIHPSFFIEVVFFSLSLSVALQICFRLKRQRRRRRRRHAWQLSVELCQNIDSYHASYANHFVGGLTRASGIKESTISRAACFRCGIPKANKGSALETIDSTIDSNHAYRE